MGEADNFKEIMSKCILGRAGRITSFVDQMMEDSKLLQSMGFPEGVKLNMDKLVMLGHSLGGITALCAAKDPRFKACLAMDPALML
jgi:predicted dienelactone hydrolase